MNSEQLQKSREYIRHKISQFPEILNDDPESWWRSAAKFLINFRAELIKNQDPEVLNYFLPQIDSLIDQLRSAMILTPKGLDDFASLADHIIMNFSMEIASPFEKKEFSVKTNFFTLNEIVSYRPERFKIVNRNVNGEECFILQVKHPTQDYFEEIPLPKNRKVWHKGGPARAVLNAIAGAPLSMQESEFPWNDFDALVGNKRRNKIAALKIGVDADGIEYMGEDDLNFPRYCAGRDTTQNQVCLGAEGLYFSDDAYSTAVSGHTRIENEYVSNKAIYGFDKMSLHGESLAKPRGLMRLIKAVIEGKALSFYYLPLNSRLDLGTNSLFLAKRWSNRDIFPEYLQRMFYLMKQMNQVRDGERDIFDTLERVHTENPFFDFSSEVRFPIEVVRWKARKLVKQIDREMGWRFQIPNNMDVQRMPGDNIPKLISLEGFKINPEEMNISDKWKMFLERSRRRTIAYQALCLPAYDQIFNKDLSEDEPIFFGHDDL
jgi:hypothetical protein